MTAFAPPTWRALSHFFCCLQGERGCNKSQKIWSGSPAALPFSLKGKRISQILEKKTPNPFPNCDRNGNNNIYACETMAGLTCCLQCVCCTCWTAHLQEVPGQAEGQAMARGGGNAPPTQLEQLSELITAACQCVSEAWCAMANVH